MDKRARINASHEDDDRITLRGRTPEEVDGYLLSGEPDDLSYEYFDE
ncbi:MAG: hypothetical protein GX166_01255 [Clostridiaceae bacterium]|nr:hypothetical protein [Clostridiaceae bacterium]